MVPDRHASMFALAVSLVVAGGGGCDVRESAESARFHAASGIDDQEGAVCGMLLREQPAPRAQVVHRDGERAFLCSIGDLLVHLEVPSPHGAPEAVFVEVAVEGEDPLAADTGAHPWVPADEAVYVVGVPRAGIMGEPVIAFARTGTAEEFARAHPSTRVLGFDELVARWRARVR